MSDIFEDGLIIFPIHFLNSRFREKKNIFPFGIATQVIELDPSSNTTRFVGPTLSAAANKWVGGVLASNGKIYAIPRSSSSTILVIDTRSAGTLCTPVLESAYFNKY